LSCMRSRIFKIVFDAIAGSKVTMRKDQRT
jgi:hypothetical protein